MGNRFSSESSSESLLDTGTFCITRVEKMQLSRIEKSNPTLIQDAMLQIFAELNSLGDPESDQIILEEVKQLPLVLIQLIYEYGSSLSLEQFSFFSYLFCKHSTSTW